MKKYPRTYKLLKEAGHSPVWAERIIADSQGRNGDEIARHAIDWIRLLRKSKRRP